MNREDIIRMAREAGIQHAFDSEGQWDGLTNETIIERHPDNEGTKSYRLERLVEILEPFAVIVSAAERTRLANAIEAMPFGDTAASFAVWIRDGGKV